jgi:hypothetical protein
MSSDRSAPRLLGAAFLVVVLTSLSSGLLRASVVGSGGISDVLLQISRTVPLLRLTILDDLLTSLGVVVLAVLLYIVLNNQSRIIALVALGWWLAEAMALAISKAGTLALIPLSLEFVKAGAPDHSYYQALGEFLYDGVDRQLGVTMHMFFYCVGGILWYSLFFKSRYIPRVISFFGLVAVSVALVGIVVELLGHDVSILAFLPILPFELTIGAWLLIKGMREGSETSIHLAAAKETTRPLSLGTPFVSPRGGERD